MLTHARVLEMNITCCKILQAKLHDPEALERLEDAIALCTKWLDAMEKHGSCTIIPDTGKCVICELPFSTTRDCPEEIVHCCFSRAHTRCLDTSAPNYCHKDLTTTCGNCSGALTEEVYERVEGYADLCVQRRVVE